MNSKHRKILDNIYSNPIKPDIKWSDIESLFEALGATITEGNGSRVRILLNGERAVFHRPHPDANTDRGAIKSVRVFLNNARIKI